MGTHKSSILREEDERQNELEASGQEADTNGAREDENFSDRKMIAAKVDVTLLYHQKRLADFAFTDRKAGFSEGTVLP